MARFESDSLTKKSSKFENFLKKNLDENTYDRVRAYEACIVCSAKEQKAFKYVVLSDECLFLTENPPSTITVAVKLEDLFGIELVSALYLSYCYNYQTSLFQNNRHVWYKSLELNRVKSVL